MSLFSLKYCIDCTFRNQLDRHNNKNENLWLFKGIESTPVLVHSQSGSIPALHAMANMKPIKGRRSHRPDGARKTQQRRPDEMI
jgi:hypothetical protein